VPGRRWWRRRFQGLPRCSCRRRSGRTRPGPLQRRDSRRTPSDPSRWASRASRASGAAAAWLGARTPLSSRMTAVAPARLATPSVPFRVPELAGVRRLLRVGRWILLLAELLPFALYPREMGTSPAWRAMLGVVVLYNAAALRFVWEERLGGPPV